MKRILKISGITFLIMLFVGLKNTVSAQPMEEVTYQDFYDELSPYGRWIEYPDYGYVWCPDEGPDFRPYSTNGRWVWSDDYDWMWVSDYSWGWAPFHYGRWFYDPLYGWMWVPGYEWSPAWVTWRSGGGYYGWAPIMPGISISVGFSWGSYNCPVNYWSFAPSRYITHHRIYDYCVSPRQNVTIINNTTIINNNVNFRRNVFVNGPGRREAERFVGGRISPVRIREAGAPGRAGFRNNEVAVYRPSVQRNNANVAPRRFDNYRGNSANVTGRNNNTFGSGALPGRIRENNRSDVAAGRFSERRDDNGFSRRDATMGNRMQNNAAGTRAPRINENFSQRGGNSSITRGNRTQNTTMSNRATIPQSSHMGGNSGRVNNENVFAERRNIQRQNTQQPNRNMRVQNNNAAMSRDFRTSANGNGRSFNQSRMQSSSGVSQRQSQPRRVEMSGRSNNSGNTGSRAGVRNR